MPRELDEAALSEAILDWSEDANQQVAPDEIAGELRERRQKHSQYFYVCKQLTENKQIQSLLSELWGILELVKDSADCIDKKGFFALNVRFQKAINPPHSQEEALAGEAALAATPLLAHRVCCALTLVLIVLTHSEHVCCSRAGSGAEEDWERDSKDLGVVNFDGFVDAIMEVVVLWAEPMTVESCIQLLDNLVNCVRSLHYARLTIAAAALIRSHTCVSG